jgi:imidazolonepropionase-like amidohydrolase
VIEDGALLIEGDRVRHVGASTQLPAPDGATVVDLSGRTVIPALIDAHAHIGYEGYTGWGADHYTRDNVIEHLERYAYYGFGAVFSAGSDPDGLALGLGRDQEQGRVGGARFLFAAGMAPPGQGPNNQFLGHVVTLADRLDMSILWGVASPDEGREAVRRIAARDLDFVKIWVDDRGGTQEKLSPPVYRAVADEARRLGLKVVVHQQTAEDMPGLLEAGVSGFLHGRIGGGLDTGLARQIHDAGAFVVPNLGLGELRGERVADDPFLQETVPASVVARLRRAFDERHPDGAPPRDPRQERELSAGFTRLMDADAAVVLGTDSGAVPDHFFGYTGHRELEIFVRLGMTPMQAIVAATSRPAEHLGLSDMGILAPGKSADFVILRDNPLDDIRNTRSIERVFLRGVEVDREGLRRHWLAGE